ncbi:MAG: diacylglycerol/lipid kinase family protein [Candidatus Enteromonas sp.]
MDYLFYNELSDSSRGKAEGKNLFEELKEFYPDLQLKSVQEVNPGEFIASCTEEDNVILAGGDGTLNHAINLLGSNPVKCHLLFRSFGTGNDFFNDVADKQDPQTKLVPLNEYIKDLPTIEVKGKTYRFINGIGFGIDGDCCVEAERLKAEGAKEINYSNITIKLLFGPFKPRKATVTVDGVTQTFEKVYLASAMNGRYYGGGMNIAPNQKRGSGLLTSVVIHGKGKLGTFMMFPSIFKGKHVKDKKHVSILQGKEITVTFDVPCGLQIDGEVVEDVTTYKAYVK